MLLARVLAPDGDPAQQADISSIAYSVYDLHPDPDSTQTGTLVVADVIFDALQTDSRWTADATGYNFRWDAPASLFATGGHTYRVEVTLTPASGELIQLRWERYIQETFRS